MSKTVEYTAHGVLCYSTLKDSRGPRTAAKSQLQYPYPQGYCTPDNAVVVSGSVPTRDVPFRVPSNGTNGNFTLLKGNRIITLWWICTIRYIVIL